MTSRLWFLPLVIVLGGAFIASGAVLCWLSKSRDSCTDWDYGKVLISCDYTSLNPIASSKCNTVCYCQTPAFDYECKGMYSGVSPTYIGWGVVLMVMGIFGIIGGVTYILISR